MGQTKSRNIGPEINNECVVCREPKKEGIKCNGCRDTLVCQDCILSLCEHGICDKCPVCRRLKWKKNKFKTNQIIPLKSGLRIINSIRSRGNEILNNTPPMGDEKRCYNRCKDGCLDIFKNCKKCVVYVSNNICSICCKTSRETINFWKCSLNRDNFKENLTFIFCIIPVIIYVLGLIGILIFYPGINWNQDFQFIWLPFLVGFGFLPFIMWCSFKTCGIEYRCNNN